MLLVHLEDEVHFLAGDFDPLDGADLDTRDAHGRPDAQPDGTRKAGLEVVALPEEALGAGEREDGHRGDGQRHTRQHADFQFRPGERTCSRHMLVLET
jgi:hypothetical protein